VDGGPEGGSHRPAVDGAVGHLARAGGEAARRSRCGPLDAAAEAPSVRLVSRYDCYLLGSRFGRQHLVARDVHRRLAAHPRGRYEGSAGHNCVLVDGRVQGMWEPRLLDDRVEVRVETFAPTDSAERQMLDREAERLAAFYERPAELVTAELDQPS
jgi:hypothetical protein